MASRKRGAILAVSVTPEEKEAIKQAAYGLGLDISSYVRLMTLYQNKASAHIHNKNQGG